MTADEEGNLVCAAAGSWLSPRMNELLPRLAAAAASPPARRGKVRWGSRWHCVADGQPMTPTDGHVACPRCGRYLESQILYELTEFNVHQAPG
jgi:hypothetical protein